MSKHSQLPWPRVLCSEVLIPDGAVEGAQLDFKSPDGVWMKVR